MRGIGRKTFSAFNGAPDAVERESVAATAGETATADLMDTYVLQSDIDANTPTGKGGMAR